MFFVEAVMRRFLKANFKKSIVLSYDKIGKTLESLEDFGVFLFHGSALGFTLQFGITRKGRR